MNTTAAPASAPPIPLKYGLDDKPPQVPFLLYSLQWWVVSLPCIVIMGVVVARMHYADAASQILSMQKLFGLIGVTLAFQSLFSHRLPLIAGPASTLLVGLTASVASGVPAQYTAIFIGGAALAVAGFTGFMSRLRALFTSRIVAVVLMLIAFTMAPTILRLILPAGGDPGQTAFQCCFAIAMVFALVIANDRLPGVAKSLTVILGMVGGTAVQFLVLGVPALPVPARDAAAPFFIEWEFHAGTVLSFLLCFLALAINELGSIEAIGHMLRAGDMERRVRLGTGWTGVANMAAGCLGVIGPVDFSLSAGLIPASGCASRYTMVPAGIGLAACAFSPNIVLLLSALPGPVMGVLLLYLMASQLASGLITLSARKGVTDFTGGMIVGLPMMLGLIISFSPAGTFDVFPDLLRPVIGNGFVMGTIAVLVLEHGVFRRSGKA